MGALFGGGSGTAPERYAGIQVSTSLAGEVLPLVYGRNRVPQNLIYYTNFKSTPASSGGKGGSSPSSFTYSAAWIAALSIGPIQGIITVWNEKSITSLVYENLALALGTTGQAIWSGYPSGTPSVQQIPYSNVAYVASQDYDFGSSAAMPNLTYEIEGVLPGFSDAHGMYDADPSAVVVDYLTNAIHGAGFSGAIAPLQGVTNTYQAYCGALGLFTSPYEDNQRSATDFMQELMQITNSDIVVSCGTLKVVPYADTAVSGTTPDGTAWSYTPNLTPIFSFGDGDYCPQGGDEPVILTRKALTDTYNIVNLQYNDRADYYNQAPVSASDNWDISIRGPRCMSTLSFQQITTAAVAKTAAQLILNFQLYERNTYEFRVRADYSLLEPMDYIAITDSGLGLTNQVCRIIEVQDDKDNYITLKVMEVPGTVRNTPQYNWSASQGYFANFGTPPPSVNPPAIFQMPPIPAALTGGIAIGIAVCAPNGTTNWGGCQIWCSSDGGNTYEPIGTVGQNGPANYGTIGALPLVKDIDTTSTLVATLANSTGQLSTAATQSDAISMATPCLIDSGANAEIIAYGAASLVSAGVYDLSYLRRGQYGSSPAAHSAGALFVRLDGAIYQIAFDPGIAGQQLFFKFLSFNIVGLQTQALSSATAYAYTVPSANAINGSLSLTPRGNAAVNSDQNLVYKILADAGSWDADAFTQSSAGALSISGQWTQGGAQIIGLATTTASIIVGQGGGFANFYGFYPHGDAGQIVIGDGPNGTVWTLGSVPNKNDLFEVVYDGFTMRYFYQGALVWSSQHQGLSLYGYTSFFEPGGTFSNVNVTTGAIATPVQFVATGNCVVNDTNAFKQGGANAWDSAVYSVTGYLTCHVSAKINFAGVTAMIGLATSPVPTAANIAASRVYAQANYAWYSDSGSGFFWSIYESGSQIATFSAPSANDVPAIQYDGSTVSYVLNGAIVRTVPVSGLLLYGFVPIATPGSGVNSLLFGPGTALTTVSIDNQVVDGASYARTLSAYLQSGVPYVYRGAWSSTTSYNIGDQVSLNGSFYVAIAPNLNAAPFNASTSWELMGIPTIWQATGNCNATDTNLYKQGGANAWDAACYTVQGYLTCHITGKWNLVAENVMLGLATVPVPTAANVAAGTTFAQANYAIYNSGGGYYIYESGTNVGFFGAMSLSDAVAITYDATTVTYLLNGNVLRTVSAPGLFLYGYCPFGNPNSGINSLRYGPTTNLAVTDTSQIATNAATSVYEQSVAGPVNVSAALPNNTLIAALTIPAIPYATTHVLTMTGTVTIQSGATVPVGANLQIYTGPTQLYTQLTGENQVASTTCSNGFSGETIAAVAANTAVTYNFYGAGGGTLATMNNVTCKVEVIKR